MHRKAWLAFAQNQPEEVLTALIVAGAFALIIWLEERNATSRGFSSAHEMFQAEKAGIVDAGEWQKKKVADLLLPPISA